LTDTVSEYLPLNDSNTESAQNHLSATLFLAALLHGVIIMGVTFTAGEPEADSDRSTSLEVVILTSDYEHQAVPEDAEMLAESNLVGAGNTNEDIPVKVAYGDNVEAALPGQPQDGVDNPQELMQQAASDDLLVYSRVEDANRFDPQEQTEESLEQMRMGLSGDSNPTEIMADPDKQTVIRSKNPRELVISANTRESRIATYLEGWKRKIERVGTMNFPNQVDAAERNPVLEVAISADGTLKEVIVLRSSGVRELDQAAINILTLASPFDPFPDSLKTNFDVLRFSYEWYFTGGGSRISVSEKQ